jgi:hypothetical protein
VVHDPAVMPDVDLGALLVRGPSRDPEALRLDDPKFLAP